MELTRQIFTGSTFLCTSGKRCYAFVCLLILSVLSFPVFGETMEYRYWNGTSGRNIYELALLELALRKTASSYPAYSIQENNENFVSTRARREIQRGGIINIFTAPVFLNPETNIEGIISVPIPILKGLLGYRKIIIREEDADLFASIKSDAGLKALRAGQGRDWQDNVIYQANAYKLVNNGEFDQLAPMLSQHRFDYIPLGIAEIEEIYSAIGGKEKNMIIDPAILIYYPLPVLFHISGNHPKLAERLKKGLTIAAKDGSLDALFQQSFSPYVNKLNARDHQLFVLRNPYLSAEFDLRKPVLLK